MRKGIAYLLIATLGLSVWTFWRGTESAQAVVVEPVHRTQNSEDSDLARDGQEKKDEKVSVPETLPKHWTTNTVTKALRNPFVTEIDAAPPPPKPKPDPQPIVQETIQPQTPALVYRLVGKVVGTNGLPVLFLQKGEVLIEARPGVVLEDGYSVEEVGKNSISVIHPVSGYRTTLTLPDIPE